MFGELVLPDGNLTSKTADPLRNFLQAIVNSNV